MNKEKVDKSLYIIKRKDKVFVHVGLYINKDLVLHYASNTNNMFAKDQIVRTSNIGQFSIDRTVELLPIATQGRANDFIFQRAIEFGNNRKKYNVVNNNCLSFVIFCLSGDNKISIFETLRYALTYRIFLFSVFSI